MNAFIIYAVCASILVFFAWIVPPQPVPHKPRTQ